MFFSGGNGLFVSRTETFLLNGEGTRLSLPDLGEERWGACAVILNDQDGSTTQVGVLGGYGRDYLNSMERYRRTKGETPTCDKETDGPAMNQHRVQFGCGILQTGQGATVLLALRRYSNQPTEILTCQWRATPGKHCPPTWTCQMGITGTATPS